MVCLDGPAVCEGYIEKRDDHKTHRQQNMKMVNKVGFTEIGGEMRCGTAVYRPLTLQFIAYTKLGDS